MLIFLLSDSKGQGLEFKDAVQFFPGVAHRGLIECQFGGLDLGRALEQLRRTRGTRCAGRSLAVVTATAARALRYT